MLEEKIFSINKKNKGQMYSPNNSQLNYYAVKKKYNEKSDPTSPLTRSLKKKILREKFIAKQTPVKMEFTVGVGENDQKQYLSKKNSLKIKKNIRKTHKNYLKTRKSKTLRENSTIFQDRSNTILKISNNQDPKTSHDIPEANFTIKIPHSNNQSPLKINQFTISPYKNPYHTNSTYSCLKENDNFIHCTNNEKTTASGNNQNRKYSSNSRKSGNQENNGTNDNVGGSGSFGGGSNRDNNDGDKNNNNQNNNDKNQKDFSEGKRSKKKSKDKKEPSVVDVSENESILREFPDTKLEFICENLTSNIELENEKTKQLDTIPKEKHSNSKASQPQQAEKEQTLPIKNTQPNKNAKTNVTRSKKVNPHILGISYIAKTPNPKTNTQAQNPTKVLQNKLPLDPTKTNINDEPESTNIYHSIRHNSLIKKTAFMNSKKEPSVKEKDQLDPVDTSYDTSIKLGDRFQAKIPNLDLGYGRTKDKCIFNVKGYYYKGMADRINSSIYTKQNISNTNEEKLKVMFGEINEKGPNSIIDFINKNTLYDYCSPHIMRSNVFEVKREVESSASSDTDDVIFSEYDSELEIPPEKELPKVTPEKTPEKLYNFPNEKHKNDASVDNLTDDMIKQIIIKHKNEKNPDFKLENDILYERKDSSEIYIMINKRKLMDFEEWDPKLVDRDVEVSCKFFRRRVEQEYGISLNTFDQYEFFKECKLNKNYFYYCIMSQHHFFLNFLSMIKNRNSKLIKGPVPTIVNDQNMQNNENVVIFSNN